MEICAHLVQRKLNSPLDSPLVRWQQLFIFIFIFIHVMHSSLAWFDLPWRALSVFSFSFYFYFALLCLEFSLAVCTQLPLPSPSSCVMWCDVMHTTTFILVLVLILILVFNKFQVKLKQVAWHDMLCRVVSISERKADTDLHQLTWCSRNCFPSLVSLHCRQYLL